MEYVKRWEHCVVVALGRLAVVALVRTRRRELSVITGFPRDPYEHRVVFPLLSAVATTADMLTGYITARLRNRRIVILVRA